MTRKAFQFALAAILAGGPLVQPEPAAAEEVPAPMLVGGPSDGGLLSAGSSAVVQGWDGNDWEIFRYLGGTYTQFTNNESDDRFPYQSSSSIVWQRWDGDDWEIIHFDGAPTLQISDNRLDDISPYFRDSLITWQGWDGSDWEIFQVDGLTTTPLTNNDFDDRLLFPADLLGGQPTIVSDSAASTPEPTTLVLAVLAALGFGLRRERQT